MVKIETKLKGINLAVPWQAGVLYLDIRIPNTTSTAIWHLDWYTDFEN